MISRKWSLVAVSAGCGLLLGGCATPPPPPPTPIVIYAPIVEDGSRRPTHDHHRGESRSPVKKGGSTLEGGGSALKPGEW